MHSSEVLPTCLIWLCSMNTICGLWKQSTLFNMSSSSLYVSLFCFRLWYLTFPFSCWFGYPKLVPPMKMQILPWDAAGIASHFKPKKINTFNLTVCVTFLLIIWKCYKHSVYLFQEYSSWKLALHHWAQGIRVNQGYAQLSHCVNLYVLKSLQSPHCIWMHLIANKWVVSWMPSLNVCCTEASFVRWILVLLAEKGASI